MKKIIATTLLCTLLCGCDSYFAVRSAKQLASKGQYVESLASLSSRINNNYEPGSHTSELEAFEMIYPNAEKRYYDEIEANKGFNARAYTKAMINLLEIEELYYSLSEVGKQSIAVIPPPLTERNELKKEIAKNFLDFGKNIDKKDYVGKLETYGYFKNAKKYDTLGNKEIREGYDRARREAQGIIDVEMVNNFPDNYIPTHLEEAVKNDIPHFELFSNGTPDNANLILKITLSDYNYVKPSVDVVTGTDSYTDTKEVTVMKRVTEKVIRDGKEVELVRWVPTVEYQDVDVYYKYKKFTKTTSVNYRVTYLLKEKNGKVIYQDYKDIRTEDSVKWTKYYPLSVGKAYDSFKFPKSQNEKDTISEAELKKNSIEAANGIIKNVLNNLESNTHIKL